MSRFNHLVLGEGLVSMTGKLFAMFSQSLSKICIQAKNIGGYASFSVPFFRRITSVLSHPHFMALLIRSLYCSIIEINAAPLMVYFFSVERYAGIARSCRT
jgi:hypothetical protein